MTLTYPCPSQIGDLLMQSKYRVARTIHPVGESVITREELSRQMVIVKKVQVIERDHGLSFSDIRRLTGLSVK